MQGQVDLRKFTAKILGWFRGEKKIRVVILVGLLGIALIFISEIAIPAKKNTQTHTASETLLTQYEAQLEAKLEQIITAIQGAGACKIMVTLDNGVEYIYADEGKNSNETNETQNDTGEHKTSQKSDREYKLVIIQAQNGEEALVVTEMQPKVRGVVVVCQGGGNAVVQEKIIDAVTTALSISSTRVCVMESTAQS